MKEWYLMDSPNLTSGYESDTLSEYAESNFTDVLYTDFADDIVLYNHDMSESYGMKALIQGNTANTQLKSTERTICISIGTLKAGMYVKFENSIWLITGRPGNNKSYEKAVMELCNWELKWQNNRGNIVSRWAITSSAAKYNDGENSSNIMVLGSDQLSVQIPLDSESIKIKRGVKYFIDYYMDEPTVYELTNPRNVEYNYGENNGVVNWIVKECAYSPTPDDLKYGVCNYIIPTILPVLSDSKGNPDKTTVLCKVIYKGKNIINAGGVAKTLSVEFKDKNGNIIPNIDYTWDISIIDEFSKFLHTQIIEHNKFKIWLDIHNLLAGNYLKVFVYNLEGKEIASEIFEIGGIT